MIRTIALTLFFSVACFELGAAQRQLPPFGCKEGSIVLIDGKSYRCRRDSLEMRADEISYGRLLRVTESIKYLGKCPVTERDIFFQCEYDAELKQTEYQMWPGSSRLTSLGVCLMASAITLSIATVCGLIKLLTEQPSQHKTICVIQSSDKTCILAR